MPATWDWSDLKGPQMQQLHAAIMDAFSPTGLEQMVLFGMDQKLDQITYGTNFSQRVFELIDWARANGRCQELFEQALKAVPGNAKLQQLGSLAGITNLATPSAGSKSQSKPSPALLMWQDKLEYLETAYAAASNPAQKYELKQQIAEAKAKIQELSS